MTTRNRMLLAGLLAALLALASALLPAAASSQGAGESGLDRAIAVQERNSDRLLDKRGVHATAVGEDAGAPVLKVYASRRGAAVPSRIEGVQVDVETTGRFFAGHHKPGHDKGGGNGGDPGGGEPTLSTTDPWPRPVPIGVSTGNEGECSAGTIGARLSGAGGVYALSNNHVYALENDAPIGSDVLQPGRFDTGCTIDPDHVLGQLSDFVPLRFDGTANEVDAAIARTTTADLGNATPPDGYGTPSSQTLAAEVGQDVVKYGRTTEQTEGTVTGVNGIVNVSYGSGTARFEHQVFVEGRKPFLKSGDSGSLAVRRGDNRPVGLLFAANSSGKFAVANEIDRVLAAFGASIDGS